MFESGSKDFSVAIIPCGALNLGELQLDDIRSMQVNHLLPANYTYYLHE